MPSEKFICYSNQIWTIHYVTRKFNIENLINQFYFKKFFSFLNLILRIAFNSQTEECVSN
ncbi:hypothetical protein BpHYR1_043003 [Brachionus plicatilis]|uniref:Uncharacterized protein n=1 Tax=Brachionus plicatilis TaxID=10195 RepID=A0A3M7SLS8_BRAPC|nr:hypothetical protein BpHYR1_043003 [Brachionus plicatilis]